MTTACDSVTAAAEPDCRSNTMGLYTGGFWARSSILWINTGNEQSLMTNGAPALAGGTSSDSFLGLAMARVCLCFFADYGFWALVGDPLALQSVTRCPSKFRCLLRSAPSEASRNLLNACVANLSCSIQTGLDPIHFSSMINFTNGESDSIDYRDSPMMFVYSPSLNRKR